MNMLVPCPHCKNQLSDDSKFCPYCGKPSGKIDGFITSQNGGLPAEHRVVIPPGGDFYLIVRNNGLAPVSVSVDSSSLMGAKLIGARGGTVQPQNRLSFIFHHDANARLGGSITVISDDGKRKHWWERKSKREEKIRPGDFIAIEKEQWIIGCRNIVFPPGVRRQAIRIWNDSKKMRQFETISPVGYSIHSYGFDVSKNPQSINPGGTLDVKISSILNTQIQPDKSWEAGPEKAQIPIVCLKEPGNGAGYDVVVAIDFGTRNTRIRVRWRHSMIIEKFAGTIDNIGDTEDDNSRFPTAMILEKDDRSFHFGKEAQQRIDLNQLQPGEYAVENLKTDIRNDNERFIEINKKWTNEYLLSRYFEPIIKRIDDYFSKAGVARGNLKVQYIITRPVMDYNEGDTLGKRYEDIFRLVLMNHNIEPDDIVFVLEPEAASIGIGISRQEELLAINEDDPVAVIDAGGGTTDISLARVSLKNGRISLDVKQSIPVRLDDGNILHEALAEFDGSDHVEFGGNSLDCALAYGIMKKPEEIMETTNYPIPKWFKPPEPNVFPNQCRTMKEAAAWHQRLYLSHVPDNMMSNPEHSQKPIFPNDAKLEGIYLDWGHFDEVVYESIFSPLTAETRKQLSTGNGHIQPGQIRRVFYVGGTNIDSAVRRRFSTIFGKGIASDNDPNAQSDPRIEERLNAVVDGAVWFGEQIFHPCTVDLFSLINGDKKPLLHRGDPVKSKSIRPPDVFPKMIQIDAGEEIDAALLVGHPDLPEPVEAARAFYRNDSASEIETTLKITITREDGVEAVLNVDGGEIQMWNFLLFEEHK